MREPCETYCTHGGVCELDAGHTGQHDSRYCQWDDAQSISRAAAQAALRAQPGGETMALLWDVFVPEDGGDDA